jgi:uncharacterized PurR-regulated membrane protein YhhQ (DUF165 family)
MKLLFIFIYVFLIVFSNVITASTQPFNFFYFVVPYGTFFIGLTFIFRDLIQIKIGKNKTYKLIFLSLFISALTSYLLKDPLSIVFASGITFLLSESIDTEIFSKIKTNINKKILFSGLIGGIIDSLVFVIVGLSPLGANFISWNFIFYAITGQVIIKSIVQFFAYFVIKKIKYNK